MHIFSFPPYGTGWFGFICLIPLFAISQNKKKGQAFLFYFLFSFFSYLLLLYWIPRVMVKYGDTSVFLGIIALIFLSALLSLFNGMAGILIASFQNNSYWSTLPIAAIWIARDLIIEHIFSGFPWCLLGYTQHRNLFLIQWAELGGVHLISAILVLINCFLFFALKKKKWRMGVFVISTIIAFELCGYFLLRLEEKAVVSNTKQEAGIIQPNVVPEQKYTFFEAKKKLEILFQQSLKIKEMGCKFVVWPEYTVPLYPMQDPPILRSLLQFSSEHIPIFAGFTDIQSDSKVYNAAILFANGKCSQYNKTHLTPFGEYILFRKLLFFVKRITDEINDFTPGDEIVNLELNGHLHALPICYEIIYPELVREFVKRGAEVIITISNDSWFGNSSAPYQHLSMALFRAVENRRFLIRATSNGISAIISPMGKVVNSIKYNTAGFLIATFQYNERKTIFVRWGYLFPYFCIFAFCLYAILFKLINRNH